MGRCGLGALAAPAALGALFLGLVLAAPAARAQDEEKPFFELGFVLGAAYLPDYPAAAQNHLQPVVLPYFALRGDRIRSDERGLLRGSLFKTNRFEFDVSLDGAFPADSSENDARRGMEDLDWMGEAGPRLQITLVKAARDAKVDLEIPLRAVFSTDFRSLSGRGFDFEPTLAYQNDNFLMPRLEVKLSASATFATEDLMDYFYEVPSANATATRPRFNAKGGYLGSTLNLTLTRPVGQRFRLIAIARGDFHHGAENDQSPLFRDKTTFGGGIALIWSFFQSKRTVRE
jgi:outer membrane scaffolding protein for murein synthesis (MipA/OmpV family)